LTKEQKTEFKKFIEEKEAERARFKRHCEEFGPPCGPCPPPGVGCPPPPAVNCPPPCAQPEIKCPCGCAPDCKCKQGGKCTCTKEKCNCKK